MTIKLISQQEIFNSLVAETNLRHKKYSSPGALFLKGTNDPNQSFDLRRAENQAHICIIAKDFFCVFEETESGDLENHLLKGQQKLGTHALEAVVIFAHGHPTCIAFSNTPQGRYSNPKSSDFSCLEKLAEKVRFFVFSCSVGKKGGILEKIARVAPQGIKFFGAEQTVHYSRFFADKKKTFGLVHFSLSHKKTSISRIYTRTPKGCKNESISVKPSQIKKYFDRANKGDPIFEVVVADMYESGLIVKKDVSKSLDLLDSARKKQNLNAQLNIGVFHYCSVGEDSNHLFKAAAQFFVVHDCHGPTYPGLKAWIFNVCETTFELIHSKNFDGLAILKNAVERNYSFASRFLGDLCFEVKDYMSALQHWVEAKKQGDIGANASILKLLNDKTIGQDLLLVLFEYYQVLEDNLSEEKK